MLRLSACLLSVFLIFFADLSLATQNNGNASVNLASEALSNFQIKNQDNFLLLCSKGSKEEILEAIKNGADVNKVDESGFSPLMAAAAYNPNAEVIELLLNHGAKINAQDKQFAFTPLMLSVLVNHDKKVIYELLKNGADTNIKDINGVTALMHLLAISTDSEFYFLFIGKKADIKLKDNQGNSLLMYAGLNANKDVLQDLIKSGLNPNGVNIDGETPIFWAAKNGNLPALSLFHSLGNDINKKNNLGMTPFLVAASSAKSSVLKFLIELGADKNVIDSMGVNALVHLASSNNNVDSLKFLISEKFDVNYRTKDGLTPLSAAAVNSNADIAKILILNGADLNAQTDEKGLTPLMLSAWLNPNLDVFRVLLKSGADIKIKDKNGNDINYYIKQNPKHTQLEKILANN